MNPTTAIKEARSFFTHVFQDEKIENVELEEIVFDEDAHLWRITFGFFRLWDPPPNPLLPNLHGPQRKRQYKVVMLDEDGNPKGITIRNEQLN
jgi:hypothetical protein